MDLPAALNKSETALPTGTHIAFGGWVGVVDRMLRSHAGLDPTESADADFDLQATIVLPSTEQAAAIARAQAAFPGVRLHAILLCSYKTGRPLFHCCVAESSCFRDDGPECLKEDLSQANFEADQYHRWTPAIYFGTAARDMRVDNKGVTEEVIVGQGLKTSEDKKKIGVTTSTKSPSQVNPFTFFMSPDAQKPSPAASNPIKLVNALRVLLTFGPDAAGTSKWPPDPGTAGASAWRPGPGKVGTSAWPPDPGEAGTSARPPDPGEVETSAWSLDPGKVVTSAWPPDPGEVGTSARPPDPGEVGTFPRPPGQGEVGTSAWPPDPGKVETSAWPPGPGEAGTSAWPPDPGVAGAFAWPPDPGAAGASKWPPDPGEVGGFAWPPVPGCCLGA
jgi:hypothetical protein